MSQPKDFIVLNDAPVGEAGNEDLVDATANAERLARLILASRAAAPFTVSIDAPWGMGKSSLMRQLQTQLRTDGAVTTLWFNAWSAEQANVLAGLIKSVLMSFDRNVVRRAVRQMSQRRNVVGLVRIAASVLMSLFGVSHAVDQLWELFSVDGKSRNEIRDVLRRLTADWIEHGDPSLGQRILVVFVDDLDRCEGKRIREVCEAIKLYLDVPGIVFVLGCDQRSIRRSVHRAQTSDDDAAAVEYLEKIIQIDYRVPAPSQGLARNLINGYAARSGVDTLLDEPMKTLIMERTGRNPRRIKRLLNSFVLEHSLNPGWEEVGVEHLLRLVILQHFYPGFAQRLTDPREHDPISEFLAYHDFREAVMRGLRHDSAACSALFDRFDLLIPGPSTVQEQLPEFLANLEKHLPDDFPLLNADRDFVSLLQGLAGPMATIALRELLRKPLSTVRTLGAVVWWPSEPEGLAGSKVSLRGVRVLWIDDEPEGNETIVRYLTARGAYVATVTNLDAARTSMPHARPTVLISDIARHGDVDAGFTDLGLLREEGIYSGPVIYFAGRVDEARERQARSLGAVGVTNNPHKLVAWVEATSLAPTKP